MPISSIFSNSNYFSSFIDIKAISTPANPNSGVGRIFYNVADSKLYLKKSDGTLVDLTGAGGGGGSSTFAGLTDVNLTSLLTGNLPVYNSVSGKWENKAQSTLSVAYSQLTSVPTTFTPAIHATSHHSGGGDALTLGSIAGTIGNSKISDLSYAKLTSVPTTFAPSAHTHPFSEITSTIAIGQISDNLITSAKLVSVDWAKLTSVPTTFAPSAHATSHKSGGTDVIKLDELGAPDDNATLDASTLKHGLMKKFPGGTTNFLREDGTFAAPPGAGGGISAIASATDVTFTSLADKDIMSYDSATSDWLNAKLVNANVSGSAAIAYSKLNLATSIVNADVSTSAAIAYSKLNLATSIVNADIHTSAAIAWSKINKTGSILDDVADVTITAAAQYDILYRNGTSEWVNLAKGGNSTVLQVTSGGVVQYGTVTNAMLAGSIAYSKLSLTGSIVDADIVGLAYGKLTSVPSTFAPSAHATTHKSAGTDSIKLDELAAPTDITTLNSTTTAHGLLKKLSNVSTEFMNGVGNWATPAGGGGTIPLLAYTYIIYKTGANYIAYNTVTKVEEFSNTTPQATFNSVITAMNTAGGGTAFLKNGLYPISGPITPKHFCKIIGENKYNTIMRCTTLAADSSMFRYYNGASSAPLEGFELHNLQFEMQNLNGDGTGDSEAVWYSSGTKNFKMYDCIIKSFATGGTFSRIGFFMDTINRTNFNENAEVKFNEFVGSCGGQDMFGCGNMLHCDVSENYFHDLTSQAIGVGASYRTLYNQNRFVRTGNCVGLENICDSNEINDNICYITTGIKLSQESTTTNVSTRNYCCRNIIQYGNGGIEDGNGHGDIIEDNDIYRTGRNGIRGAFVDCSIQRNKLTDTNFNNNSQTINAVSSTTGGIIMINNTTPIPDADNNVVKDNILVDTGVAFTDPVSGLSKNGNTGPIILDTSYDNNFLIFNKFQGLPAGDVIDYGTNTLRIQIDSKLLRVQSNLEDNLNVYRKTKTVNDRIGLTMEGDDSTDARVVYGKVQMQILDPLTSSKDSYLSVRYLVANTSAERFYAFNNGIGFGASAATSIEQYSGASGGLKTITWGNFSGEPSIINAAQTLTNKWIQGIRGNYNPKTANYTAVATDDYIPVDATSGNITITLPTAVGIGGKTYTFTKIDASANTVIIDGAGIETINGALTNTLTTQYQTVTIWSNNVGWLAGVSTSSATVTNLDDIGDVVITTPASQDVIVRNASSQWVNQVKGANNEVFTISSGGTIDWDLIDNANIDAAAAIAATKLDHGTAGQYLKTNAGGTAAGWETDSLSFALDDATDVTISGGAKRNQSLQFDSTQWVNSIYRPEFDKDGQWYALVENPGYGTGLMSVGLTAVGTVARNDDATSGHENTNTQFTTASAATPAVNTVGLKQTTSYYRRNKYTRYYATFFCSNFSSNTRGYFGVTSTTTDMTGDVPLEGGVEGILVGITLTESVAGGIFQVITNDSSGTQTKVATGVAHDSNGSYHDIEIAMSPTDAKIYIDGTLVNTATTNIPAASTNLYPFWQIHRNGGSEKNLFLINARMRAR